MTEIKEINDLITKYKEQEVRTVKENMLDPILKKHGLIGVIEGGTCLGIRLEKKINKDTEEENKVYLNFFQVIIYFLYHNEKNR
ncbi:MAG: hypothetical protein HAW67_01980 [Endozoicomonadaceae bacterium]|nr:hypothetical protein [Endozoicomonadaceae bacterium]